MDFNDISTRKSNISLDSSPSLSAKMRRLKIQEDLLVQSIKKTLQNSHGDSENIFIKMDLEFKKYIVGLKKSYADIKHLLEDVKVTTQSKEILKSLDIDEVKRDVLELDHKIKSFKTFLQREITDLKKSEKDLIKQLKDDAMQNTKKKKCAKVTTKSYSDIVPSPVKNLINSPLKSPEVQQFQDFISSSPKYGGWNEYNHNIFVRIWQKYFQCYEDFDYENVGCIEKDTFIHEILEKISGVKRKEIILHMQWYSKYLYLKKRQQIALEEWRAKTRPNKIKYFPDQSNQKCEKSFITKKGHKKNKNTAVKNDVTSAKRNCLSDESDLYSPISSNTEEDVFSTYIGASEFLKEINCASECHKSILCRPVTSSQFRFTKPTKQWQNRCKSNTDLRIFNINVEDISKLGVPTWRIGLEGGE